MSAKDAKCKQAWDKYILSTNTCDDFKAGFEAGYAAALETLSFPVADPPIAKVCRALADVQSELERRLGVKLAVQGWRIESDGLGQWVLVTSNPKSPVGSLSLYAACQNGDLHNVSVNRYRIL